MNGCFFYLIVTAHYIKYGNELVQLIGYGITVNPKKRSKQYSDHSGTEQEFCMLYYGPVLQVKSLESIIKQRIASESHKIYDEYVEWIRPTSKMTVDQLVTLVNDTIDEQGFNIRSLKDDYLPFNNLEHHRRITTKELNYNPNMYLETNEIS